MRDILRGRGILLVCGLVLVVVVVWISTMTTRSSVDGILTRLCGMQLLLHVVRCHQLNLRSRCLRVLGLETMLNLIDRWYVT